MFCPKCGTKNPGNGKYCRKCGSDIKLVSDAMSGKLVYAGKEGKKKRGDTPKWEDALTFLFVSVAFFGISIFLSFQPMAAFWWFWLLIPAFATLAQGIGQVISLRKAREAELRTKAEEELRLRDQKTEHALPPQQTDFDLNIPASKRRTKDLAVPSVVEETTRKLEMNTDIPDAEDYKSDDRA
ncbi:MAG: zinc ribbon domain-containing protein [Pyrinomonadaceae bacterium]